MSWQAQTLGHVLESRAGEALVTCDARFTYEDLLERARSAAGSLQALGIRHGERVGILMGNDEHWLSLFYGAALIGAVTVRSTRSSRPPWIDFCLKQATAAVSCGTRFHIDFGAMCGKRIRQRSR